MSTDMTLQTGSTSSSETELLGKKLGKLLKGGEVIELISDLGGGKTTFVRGLAQGLGSNDHVSSPTFKISNEYKGRFKLYHFDFYRLHQPGAIEYDLSEVIGNSSNVVVIEWADIVKGVLPSEHLTVRIKTTGENSRKFEFSMPKSLEYLLKGLK